MKLEASEFANMYFENKGNGQFDQHPLPDELQYSTMNTAQLADLDDDGRMEVVLGGNFFECNIEMGRYDANYGNVLSFSKNGEMSVSTLGNQKIDGEIRKIRKLAIGGKQFFVFARNNDQAVTLKAADVAKQVQ
jgi:hypothetical protein